MPELPEIYLIARQMNEKLSGLKVNHIESFQPKCLNFPVDTYNEQLTSKNIVRVRHHGKWIKMDFEDESMLNINLGMGGEICHFTSMDQIPDKVQFRLHLENNEGFFVSFWWFGYIHLVFKDEIHEMTSKLGPDILDLNPDEFLNILKGKRGKIKSFLLNQKNVSGIGNFYIQEILFYAKLHPDRIIPELSADEIKKLYTSIQSVLQKSIQMNSSSYELDYLGNKGSYDLNEMAFAYQEEGRCPDCGVESQKIKTGSNAQYICPVCQKL